jgi:hypothetical protein
MNTQAMDSQAPSAAADGGTKENDRSVGVLIGRSKEENR